MLKAARVDRVMLLTAAAPRLKPAQVWAARVPAVWDRAARAVRARARPMKMRDLTVNQDRLAAAGRTLVREALLLLAAGAARVLAELARAARVLAELARAARVLAAQAVQVRAARARAGPERAAQAQAPAAQVRAALALAVQVRAALALAVQVRAALAPVAQVQAAQAPVVQVRAAQAPAVRVRAAQAPAVQVRAAALQLAAAARGAGDQTAQNRAVACSAKTTIATSRSPAPPRGTSVETRAAEQALTW
jgi:hypothetical protein